jgi:hypothetical protein
MQQAQAACWLQPHASHALISSLQESLQEVQRQLQQQPQIAEDCWGQLLSLAQRLLQEGLLVLAEQTTSS